MSTVKYFEDLVCWQKARELVNIIYSYTRKPEFSKDPSLVDQIRRASVSVMSNIAEGFERGGKDEIVYFLYIAKASCGEVRSQLYVALDEHYISKVELDTGLNLAKHTSALVFGFIDSLKVSQFKGLKFKRGETEYEKGQHELEEMFQNSIPDNHPLKKKPNP